MRFGAVIAAAGKSGRMNAFMKLSNTGDMTMTERVVMNFRQAGIDDIVVVTGLKAEEVEKREMVKGLRLAARFYLSDNRLLHHIQILCRFKTCHNLSIPVYQEFSEIPLNICCILISRGFF